MCIRDSVLTVYALDHRLSLAPDASPADLMRAVSGRMLAAGTLTGRYSR